MHLQRDTGAAHLHLGPRLPPGTRDLLCCDAEIRGWLHGADGTIGLGRRARVVSHRLRLAVEHRDGGCVVPGCDSTRHLRIHHIVHWMRGGPTDTANLVALCPRCHAAVHRGELTISGDPDRSTLRVDDRQGRRFQIGHPAPPDAALLDAATLRATASPWRGGEHVQWKWFDWTPPPTSRPPATSAPPVSSLPGSETAPSGSGQPLPTAE